MHVSGLFRLLLSRLQINLAYHRNASQAKSILNHFHQQVRLLLLGNTFDTLRDTTFPI